MKININRLISLTINLIIINFILLLIIPVISLFFTKNIYDSVIPPENTLIYQPTDITTPTIISLNELTPNIDYYLPELNFYIYCESSKYKSDSKTKLIKNYEIVESIVKQQHISNNIKDQQHLQKDEEGEILRRHVVSLFCYDNDKHLLPQLPSSSSSSSPFAALDTSVLNVFSKIIGKTLSVSSLQNLFSSMTYNHIPHDIYSHYDYSSINNNLYNVIIPNEIYIDKHDRGNLHLQFQKILTSGKKSVIRTTDDVKDELNDGIDLEQNKEKYLRYSKDHFLKIAFVPVGSSAKGNTNNNGGKNDELDELIILDKSRILLTQNYQDNFIRNFLQTWQKLGLLMIFIFNYVVMLFIIALSAIVASFFVR
ncbi:uncharacterized protein SCDLUD_004273 [Saccharomycodes ludwigii]|uniref:uncharacterized protein n=1 Tax=Saccharomycodes ludwigii TaxID=36035 RepID=UPI001E8A8621|nr:hypothetical protein SCDLUD_004273 [Saccharomycodes ludwigii]KAH3899957.1 hypothetical protein SCDLUD_004273 [Saccharomycodes ludwigii]